MTLADTPATTTPSRILQTTADTLPDLRVDTAVEAKWKACAEEGATACGANEARVLELCGDLTLDDIDPRFEGDVTGLNYAKTILQEIDDGTITVPTTARRRILAGTGN